MTYQVPRQVRKAPATLYPKERETRRLINEVGLDEISIEFSDRAIDNWYEILVEAQKHNKVESILKVVAGEYRESREYLCARLAYIVSQVEINSNTAIEIYRQRRSWVLRFDQSIETLEDILEDLWDRLHVFDGSHPLIDYVEQLACITEMSPIAEQLRAWVDFAAPLIRPELTAEVLFARRAQIANEKQSKTDKPNYLTVEITPDFDDPSRLGPKLYTVETLLWRNGQQDESWESEAVYGVPLQQIAEIIDDLIEMYMDASMRKNLTIEFLLPNALFLHEVDQWPRKHTDVPGVTLGMDYPVVVRSLRRLEKYNSWHHWDNKWQYIQEHLHELNLGHTFWLHSYNEHAPLILRSMLAEETIVPCLGMAFAFAEAPSDKDPVLGAIIETGVPISFWLRPCQHASERSEKVKEMICYIWDNECLGDLPKHLHKVRRRSIADDSQDLGNHLTLLWDDPTRIPAKYKDSPRLRAPQNRH